MKISFILFNFLSLFLITKCSALGQNQANKKLATTTIGAYPKPEYVELPDWFDDSCTQHPSKAYEHYLKNNKDAETILNRATQEVVKEQTDIGIDIPSDGEVRRENYIYYHCRHLDGIDFSKLTQKTMRNGAWKAEVPTITGPIKAEKHFLPDDYRVAQQATKNPVKITIPGPLTIADTIADDYYKDEQKLCEALAKAINKEVLALVNAGCTWIQIDEPLLARQPEKALAFAIKNLEACFEGVPKNVKRVVHLCCGYPQKADQEDFPKADLDAYHKIADSLDAAKIDAVSLEDAHRRNDPKLFEHFKNTCVILGVIDVSRSRIETVDEIKDRIKQALKHIKPERLMIAPDCGLGLLDRSTVQEKLKAMSQAALDLRAELEQK